MGAGEKEVGEAGAEGEPAAAGVLPPPPQQDRCAAQPLRTSPQPSGA